MAVYKVPDVNEYIGLAADVKPVAAGSALPGATFYETDTGSTYVFNGATWSLVPAPAVTLSADPLGANADAAVVTDTTGTISGKLRGLVKWAFERMPASLGVKTAAASFPTVLASDHATIGVTPAAGNLHLGEVDNPTVYVTSTPTLTVGGASYVTGDYIGPSTTPASFANVARVAGGKVTIESLCIVDKTVTAAVALELWLFSATVAVPADSAAWTVSDTDALLCVGVIPIVTTKWYASGANKVYSDDAVAMVVPCAATSLFYAIVTRGTAPAWATGDVQLSLGVKQ